MDTVPERDIEIHSEKHIRVFKDLRGRLDELLQGLLVRKSGRDVETSPVSTSHTYMHVHNMHHGSGEIRSQ